MSKDKEEKVSFDGILAALQSYASPQSITTQIVTKLITSEKTKSMVRRVLIDPVQSRFVPKIRLNGYDQCRNGFNGLFILFKDKELAEILHVDESDVSTYREMLVENPYYTFSNWYYDVGDGVPKFTNLIHYGDALVYISMEFARSDRRGMTTYSTLAWSFEFIAPTKKVYELFVDKIEEAKQYINVGYMQQFERRIRVVQMGEGRRRHQVSYATVPTTVIISSDIVDDLEAVIRSVNKADDIRREFEVNKTIGVLLHGPAGTGKSTIARYLAMRLNRTLIYTGTASIQDVIDYTKDNSRKDNKYIILIEDIDFKFVDRRKLRKSKKKDAETEGANVPEEDDDDDIWDGPFGSFSETDTLFQLLDGVLGDSDVMVVATTNYKDRLDPALIRDGRFDHDIEVLGLSYADGVRVCESFGVTPKDVELEKLPIPINPATLQKLILKHKTSV